MMVMMIFNQGFIAAKMLIDANIVLFDDTWTTMVSSVSSEQLLIQQQHAFSYFSGNLLLQRMSYLT